jgi:hypothetical protein
LDSPTPNSDFNSDGLYDCLDINALVAEIAAGTHNPAFDLTTDGLVNLADRDAWLAEAGGINLGSGRVYRLGDANLDGLVDGSDFGVWNAHKFTATAAWCDGDFTADGIVDGSDYGVWNVNKFTASDTAARIRNESTDFNLALLDSPATVAAATEPVPVQTFPMRPELGPRAVVLTRSANRHYELMKKPDESEIGTLNFDWVWRGGAPGDPQ